MISKYAKFITAMLGALITVLTQLPAGADMRQIVVAVLSTAATSLAVLAVPNSKPAVKRGVPGDAKAAYEAYGEVTGHKNFLGEPMPKWEDLSSEIRSAWRAAAGGRNG